MHREVIDMFTTQVENFFSIVGITCRERTSHSANHLCRQFIRHFFLFVITAFPQWQQLPSCETSSKNMY